MKILLTGECKLCIDALPTDIARIVELSGALESTENLKQLVETGAIDNPLDFDDLIAECNIDTATDEFCILDYNRRGINIGAVEIVNKETAELNDTDFIRGDEATMKEYDKCGGAGGSYSYYYKFVEGDLYFRPL